MQTYAEPLSCNTSVVVQDTVSQTCWLILSQYKKPEKKGKITIKFHSQHLKILGKIAVNDGMTCGSHLFMCESTISCGWFIFLLLATIPIFGCRPNLLLWEQSAWSLDDGNNHKQHFIPKITLLERCTVITIWSRRRWTLWTVCSFINLGSTGMLRMLNLWY